jgi:hypothetical protein
VRRLTKSDPAGAVAPVGRFHGLRQLNVAGGADPSFGVDVIDVKAVGF